MPEYDMMENITARYNIVYHGRKIIGDVIKSDFASHRENFQQLLPIFIEPTEETASANAQLMDSVIGKSLDIINKKSRSKYINEAYMLTGVANYLKGNYYNAAEFFTYTANTFASIPAYRQAALTWKARALIQLGNFTAAGSVLDTVFMSLESDPRSMGMAFATQAKYYLLTDDSEAAITMLLQALEHTKDKPTRLRWHFLLGQLLQSQGRQEEAYKHYSRVVNSNAPYDMAFHADLNRIFLTTEDNKTNDERIKLLRRILKDGKNSAFKDQIYFQIAELLYQAGDITGALTNYQLALQQQSDNQYQTTRTYLQLADHYFGRAQYETAKLYYDSVGMFMPLDFPDAGPVQRKIANLDELIGQLKIVSRQDTMLYLAGLSEVGRTVYLDSLVRSRYAQIQISSSSTEKQRGRPEIRSPFDNAVPQQAQSYSDNRFYFNNPDAMGMGMSEFKRRWGNRPLQDNWRFSDMVDGKAPSDPARPGAEEVEVAVVDSALLDSTAWATRMRDAYIAELPDSDEKAASAHRQIHDALLKIGVLYRDDLRDEPEAIATFEEVLERYPNTEDAAMIYYNLYRLYEGINPTFSVEYREKLLSRFPDALYSRIVVDPQYLAKVEAQKQVLNRVYEEVYTRYTQLDFQSVIQMVDSLFQQPHEQQPVLVQLAYLRALALGRISPLDTFETALVELIENFPDDSLIRPLANEHLAFIAQNRAALQARQFALQHVNEGRERFVDEPTMTLWPQLVIYPRPDRRTSRRELTVSAAGQARSANRIVPDRRDQLTPQQVARVVEIDEIGENTYRDRDLLPDSAVYYFVINIMNERVNLAPSRFGIGQFNRSRYAGWQISHQLTVINDENQLIYIGPFSNYEEARGYEARITPLLADIMKIPPSLYNTFLITESNFGTLSDFDKIDDYYSSYHEQKQTNNKD